MPWAAAAAAVAAVGSAAISANASSDAASTQAGAANRASNVTAQQLAETNQNLAPFLGAGTNSLAVLMSSLGLSPQAPAMTGGSGPSVQDLISAGTGFTDVAFGPAGATNAPVYKIPYGAPGSGITNADPNNGTLLGYLNSPLVNNQINPTPSGQSFTTLAQLAAQGPGSGSGGIAGVLQNSPLLRQPTAADFTSSPGYQFELQQGLNAITNQGSATGPGGNTLRDLMTFGTGLASQDWWNFYNTFTNNQNRVINTLTGLAGAGQNAAVQQGGFGASAAGQIGNNTIGAGNASAAGQVGTANAIGGGFSNLSQLAQLAFLNQQNQTPTTSPGGQNLLGI